MLVYRSVASGNLSPLASMTFFTDQGVGCDEVWSSQKALNHGSVDNFAPPNGTNNIRVLFSEAITENES